MLSQGHPSSSFLLPALLTSDLQTCTSWFQSSAILVTDSCLLESFIHLIPVLIKKVMGKVPFTKCTWYPVYKLYGTGLKISICFHWKLTFSHCAKWLFWPVIDFWKLSDYSRGKWVHFVHVYGTLSKVFTSWTVPPALYRRWSWSAVNMEILQFGNWNNCHQQLNYMHPTLSHYTLFGCSASIMGFCWGE